MYSLTKRLLADYGMTLILAWMLLTGMPVKAMTLVPPQQLIKETSDKIQQELRKINYKVDFAKAVEIVEQHIEPHVDFDRFAALVLGKYWRQATPEQKERFKKEFKTMLIRTYATAYGEYAEWSIRFKPLKSWSPDVNKVIVQTEFMQPGSEPVPVDFRMILNGGQWKVYDVIIGGVDLVKNYRTSFAQEIAKTGSLDALIEQITERNRQAFKDGAKASALVQPIPRA